MSQGVSNDKALQTLLDALKALSKWSPKVRSLDDAKAYLLETFPAHDSAHKQQQLAFLSEIIRQAGYGRNATVIELIKKLSTPQSPEPLDPEDTDAGIHASFRKARRGK